MLTGPDAASLPEDCIAVARVGDAWGIKGWFRVLPYSAQPEALFSCQHWFLLAAPSGKKTFPALRELTISEAKMHSGSVVANALEIGNRDAAQALHGATVFIPRAAFPSTNKDEYYWVDLIGLSVVNRQGVELGTVKDLLATGEQTTLVIECQQQEKLCEQMIPFVSRYVDQVDLPARRMVVDWQADYWS